MKRLMFGMVGLAAMAAAFAPAVRATPTTVKGELIDTSCGKNGEKGEALEKCSKACAGRGEPVAVYTADGGVYLVKGAYSADKNAKLIEFMGKTVEVTGEVTKDKDGKMSIEAEKVTVAK
jgi:hypothetical protein